MSADWWVVAHRPDCKRDDCGCPASEWLNVTYNLTPMLREAGLFPNAHKDLQGAPCAEVAGVAESALRRLQENPEHFRAMNPPNGLGTYEVAVEFVSQLRDVCSRWSHIPSAELEGWL